MTRAELWATYVARNPSFAGDGNVTLSAAGLRKLFDQTWEKGEEAGRVAATPITRDGTPFNGKPFGDLFGEMFGAGHGSKGGHA